MKNKKTMLCLVSILLIIVVISVIYILGTQNKDEKTTTTLGRLELIVVDENNNPVAGSVFNLIDSYNNTLMEVKTSSDGVIDFYSVPVGDYTIKQISAPEGYTIKESSKKVTVVGGELTTVKVEN